MWNKSKSCTLLYMVTPENALLTMSAKHNYDFESFNNSWAGKIKAIFWGIVAFVPALVLSV